MFALLSALIPIAFMLLIALVLSEVKNDGNARYNLVIGHKLVWKLVYEAQLPFFKRAAIKKVEVDHIYMIADSNGEYYGNGNLIKK